MRIRFSLRWLLTATTLVAVACYGLIVRPTVIAQQFVDAVNAKDFRRAERLCGDGTAKLFTHILDDAREYNVNVELVPRRRADLCSFRQRLRLQVIPTQPQGGSSIVVGMNADLVATSFGLQQTLMYPLIYKH